MLIFGCLIAFAVALAPRVVLVLAAIFSARWDQVWSGKLFLWPLLGIIFAPYTTVMYMLAWNPATGISGFDWFWIGLGVLLDLVKWGLIGDKRKEIPGYPSAYERTPQTAYEAELHEPAQAAVSKTDAELEKLADLRDKGVISDEEYEAKKQQLGE
jgi:hypothetical protein